MNWQDDRVANSGGVLNAKFVSVAEAFAANFEDGLENGASFAVMIGGECVVDIRGGFCDRKKEQPWTADTLACVYSGSKAVLAFLIAREVSRGTMAYDARVADYWPDFAANGKADVTLAQAMSHQGGLCGIAEEMPPAEWLDWDNITGRLAAMAPLWQPGTANGYHPQTVGFIIGEVLRRVTGKTVGALLGEIRDSDGLEVYCGLSDAEIARATFMQKPPKAPDLGPINEFKQYAFLKSWSAPAKVSHEDWMAAEIPASNMHMDARSFAAIVHPLANGGISVSGEQVLTGDAINDALKERIRGDDLVLPFHLSWSAGLMRNINRHFGPNEDAFGHAGFGGASILVDPQNNLTAAYVMNKMSPYLVGDPRAVRLLDAVYAAF